MTDSEPTAYENLRKLQDSLPEGATISYDMIEHVLEQSNGVNALDTPASIAALIMAVVDLDRIVYATTKYQRGRST